MPENIGTINLELTSNVTWPTASGYTNGFGSNNPQHVDVPSDTIMKDLGVHFYRLAAPNHDEYHY